jgi:hypothetical protein
MTESKGKLVMMKNTADETLSAKGDVTRFVKMTLKGELDIKGTMVETSMVLKIEAELHGKVHKEIKTALGLKEHSNKLIVKLVVIEDDEKDEEGDPEKKITTYFQ